MKRKLVNEVKAVYGDLHGLKERNLHWKSFEPVTRDEAFKIMKKVVPNYNNFQAEDILVLPKDVMIQIAREGSVCLYVTGENLENIVSKSAIDADEFTLENGVLRLWWD